MNDEDFYKIANTIEELSIRVRAHLLYQSIEGEVIRKMFFELATALQVKPMAPAKSLEESFLMLVKEGVSERLKSLADENHALANALKRVLETGNSELPKNE